MYNDNFGKRPSKGFPNPLAPQKKSLLKKYGKSMPRLLRISGVALMTETLCLREDKRRFEKNRKYANGTQDTVIYKKLLNSR